MNNFAKNLLGLFLGLIGINGLIWLAAVLRTPSNADYSVILISFGSFAYFVGLYFTKIPLLRKSFVLGVIITFVIGFITVGFIVNARDTRNLVPKLGLIACDSVPQCRLVPDTALIKFKSSYVNTGVKGCYDYEFRQSDIQYCVYPLLAGPSERPDTIHYWVGTEDRLALFGQGEEELMASVVSERRIAWRYVAPFRVERFMEAMRKANASLSMPNSTRPVFFEMVDVEAEADFWEKRGNIGVAVMNGIWLLYTIPLLWKREESAGDQD